MNKLPPRAIIDLCGDETTSEVLLVCSRFGLEDQFFINDLVRIWAEDNIKWSTIPCRDSESRKLNIFGPRNERTTSNARLIEFAFVGSKSPSTSRAVIFLCDLSKWGWRIERSKNVVISLKISWLWLTRYEMALPTSGQRTSSSWDWEEGLHNVFKKNPGRFIWLWSRKEIVDTHFVVVDVFWVGSPFWNEKCMKRRRMRGNQGTIREQTKRDGQL